VPNIFVFSAASKAARKHLEDTIDAGLPLEDVLVHIHDPTVQASLRSAYDGLAYLWAGHSGGQDERYWNQMQAGDLVLCYQQKRITRVMELVAKTRSQDLGLAAWPDETERPYDLIYFLTKPRASNVGVADHPQYFGQIYQGLRRLGKTEQVLEAFGDLAGFARQVLGVNPEPVELAAPRRSPVTVSRVVRDSEQARGVKALYDYACQVCGHSLSLPRGPYVEGAHVRPLGSPHHGPDHASNILALCPNHHVMLDEGAIAVAEDLSLLGMPGSLRVDRAHGLSSDMLRWHREHIYQRRP